MNRVALPALILAASLAAFGTTRAASPTPTASTPWAMSGTVRDTAGRPVVGVDVFADHTAYYDMNVVGKTDARGQYRLTLARHAGTWSAGAYLRLNVGGETFEVRLAPNVDVPFDGAKGAVRDFTLDPAKLPVGTVNTTVAHSNVELDYDTLSFTFTPDGPNILGSTASFTRPFVVGHGVRNVPIGRYHVSATQVRDGVKEQLLLSSTDERTFSTRVLAVFHDNHDRYGITMDLFLENAK
ncbi:carboxypeptidase regulatory-like domain-containing protein [Deinococcus yavapaiensis]|uniref:Carboxypeptidase family protein n=1 Tax=Deinococcus yavapaiensis KR-236 TaxID=694435 RepID=A0A318S7V5_9DEIO|nr:carboxypeptidase regulatory-like domain-containing protein [Deinococcus yavapaiensis]PYE53116.1 hypothetical protein DES52_110100 [Deinococcus yavapaiensis KR-236]